MSECHCRTPKDITQIWLNRCQWRSSYLVSSSSTLHNHVYSRATLTSKFLASYHSSKVTIGASALKFQLNTHPFLICSVLTMPCPYFPPIVEHWSGVSYNAIFRVIRRPIFFAIFFTHSTVYYRGRLLSAPGAYGGPFAFSQPTRPQLSPSLHHQCPPQTRSSPWLHHHWRPSFLNLLTHQSHRGYDGGPSGNYHLSYSLLCLTRELTGHLEWEQMAQTCFWQWWVLLEWWLRCS